jgi:hypothetical protein
MIHTGSIRERNSIVTEWHENWKFWHDDHVPQARKMIDSGLGVTKFITLSFPRSCPLIYLTNLPVHYSSDPNATPKSTNGSLGKWVVTFPERTMKYRVLKKVWAWVTIVRLIAQVFLADITNPSFPRVA